MKKKIIAASLREAPSIHPVSGQTTLTAERLNGLEMWQDGAFLVVSYLETECYVPLSNVKALVFEQGGKDAH